MTRMDSPFGESHPDSEQVAAYIERALPKEERSAVEEHLAECAECRQEVVELSRFFDRRGPRKRLWIGLPIAVAAAAIVMVAVWPGDAEGPATDRFRDDVVDGSGALSAIDVVTPAPDAVVAADGNAFTWRALGDDVFYRLTIASEAGEVVWRAETSDTSVSVPGSVELVPGRSYHWFVDALSPDGREATTGIRRFRVAP